MCSQQDAFLCHPHLFISIKTLWACNYVRKQCKSESNASSLQAQKGEKIKKIANRISSECNITRPNTTQPRSPSKFTDCQARFVMLCVNAAGRDCPSLAHSSAYSIFLSLDLTIWVTVRYSKKCHCATINNSYLRILNTLKKKKQHLCCLYKRAQNQWNREQMVSEQVSEKSYNKLLSASWSPPLCNDISMKRLACCQLVTVSHSVQQSRKKVYTDDSTTRLLLGVYVTVELQKKDVQIPIFSFFQIVCPRNMKPLPVVHDLSM